MSVAAAEPKPTGLPDLSDLENFALFRPAAQSSISPWSKADDARFAVNGERTGRYGFHTGHEPEAWWRVDLEAARPVRYVVLWNREDAGRERARHLEIAFSLDGETWEVVANTGPEPFGGLRSMAPFVLGCDDRPARFVRIRRTTPGVLHLDEVEVYGPALRRLVPASAFFRAIGEDPDTPAMAILEPTAAIGFAASQAEPGEVRSLSPTRYGRFGNQITQLVHSIHFARRHGIGRIHLDMVNPGGLTGMREIGGIEFHAAPADPAHGADLRARMYARQVLPRSFEGFDGAAMQQIGTAFLRPLLAPRFAARPPRAAPTLHIHLRAGDVFSGVKPHPDYVQPPLAFYRMAVRDAMRRLGVTHVMLVYEDEGNPCVGALRDWLAQEGIPTAMQSSTLEADVGELLSAENIVLAAGTFALPIFLLSERLRHVHAFRTLSDTALLEAGGVAWRVVEDAAGGYLKPGSWRNTPEQRATMLTYPAAALRLDAGGMVGRQSARAGAALSVAAAEPKPTGLPDLSNLENFALFRPAAQSSTSPWSTADDASGAVTGRRTGEPGFHTGREDAAWWQVDLEAARPVRHVVLWNREDAGKQRATNLEIEFSLDGETWETAGNTGPHPFGGVRSNTPFVLSCGDRPTRLVRIRRTRPGFLHLDEVEVYGPALRRRIPAEPFLRAIGENPDAHRLSPHERHAVISFAASSAAPDRVRSISPTRGGRFGNQVVQLLNSVHFARRHGIGRIHLDMVNPGRVTGVHEIGGIEFHAAPADPAYGADLQTTMFDRGAFPRSFEGFDGATRREIGTTFIRPLLTPRFSPSAPRAQPTLHVYLRAGDIFSMANPYNGYIQPPLAFYRMAVRDAMRRLGVTHVVLVYEDEGNPCVGALRDWLAREGIPAAIQSATLEEDVGELLAAENIVLADGTFTRPILLLSDRLRHVHAFRTLPNPDLLMAVGVAWRVVEDAAGEYLKPGEWRNTPEQRARMLTYPRAKLRFAA